MAATVAHQIGTPLNLISGYVQMIQTDVPPASASAVRLRTVQEQIGKVTTIVQGLLDQARRPLLNKTEVAAGELVEGVCELARPSLAAAQVLLNLITNSIDAMPEGGELLVTAGASGGHVEITVADSGTGIDPLHVGRVFDPLFTTKERGKGTGLGLTIARDVVAAHGGTIAVASRHDEGTEVKVRLPQARPAEQQQPPTLDGGRRQPPIHDGGRRRRA